MDAYEYVTEFILVEKLGRVEQDDICEVQVAFMSSKKGWTVKAVYGVSSLNHIPPLFLHAYLDVNATMMSEGRERCHLSMMSL